MTDIQTAKNMLAQGYTFVAVKNGDYRTSEKRGVAPIIELIDTDPDFLSGASVADKVVGKAAAMLLTAYGVKMIYTPLTSDKAINYIAVKSTTLEYDKRAEYIINRDGTAMCPMEKTVLSTDNEQEAERLIRNKIEELRRK